MAVPQKKAIALMSGGLDSALAAALTRRLGFEVVGLHLATGFCTGKGRCDTVLAQALALGIPVRLLDVAEEYLEVVKRPRFGRGQGMNPCLDCRIFMVRKAGELLEAEGASFVVTGEVLGQRPMSQHLPALELVARESGLGERLVRPLSGRLLGPTFPERMGWVRREDWLDLQGRSRKRQMELAQAWGIPAYTPPGGGCCLLLERAYAKRLRDLIREKGVDALTKEDFALLRYGRHFRLGPKVRVVVGRDELENAALLALAGGHTLLAFPDVPGPVALVVGEAGEEELRLAAELAARYSDAPAGAPVRVLAQRDGQTRELWVTPWPKDDPRLRRLRIDR
ncbi:MAG: tRNA 4-thiouridine(8) synthase ThiI [Candidatus Bipolaricaulota bacterium]|nr:tRNA 4-thiouridine(8) synthase ThiI [Candidatus Bipolaricaulota bacterium]MCX7844379.1 tRNA 4-thiouridine(8) synthase ThiI [Candidatus Bipolaricaulota bacterium]MDW8152098.1 tRNA 4-thiouridine(8) synthase ThiI [Candidatus Bipolaricaulota bacterium]